MSARERIFISVAEDSADVHAAALLRSARSHLPNCEFYGLAGPRMQAEGARPLADLTASAAMLGGVISAVPRALRLVREIEAGWRKERPAAVILLDSPELHLGMMELGLKGMAARARRLGIPVIYYIAPQTWASRPWRNRWIRRDVNHLACILPFEPAYFASQGVQAEFVGHPLFETLAMRRPDPARVARLRAADGPLIALLPGSRRHVIETMLPRQLEVLRGLRASGVPARLALSCVSEQRRPLIEQILAAGETSGEIIVGDNASLLAAADLVLVTSGTATLEVAHYRKPMIVMYDAGPLMGALYRGGLHRLVRTPHLSLVNILADARIVPEFMPFIDDVAPIVRVAAGLLRDRAWRELMIAQIDGTIRPLEQAPASANVCGLIARALAG